MHSTNERVTAGDGKSRYSRHYIGFRTPSHFFRSYAGVG